MHAYHMSLHHVLYELPVIQGLALRAGAIAIDSMVSADISDGYIRQETRRRIALK